MFDLFTDFQQLKSFMDRRFPDARQGRPSNISDTGEEYAEISFSGMSRSAPEDISVRPLLSGFSKLLMSYLEQTRGQIYWRIPLEEDWVDTPWVIRYDDAGPDVDFYTDRRCVLDRDWKRYGVYCRLLRSDKPVKEFVYSGEGK
jgi:hypothetical protein